MLLGKILTISDIDQFASLGGMIELKIQETNVKMHINLSSADKKGIHFNAKLIEVAKIQ